MDPILLFAIFLATVIASLLLYSKTASASQKASAAFGVLRNVFLLFFGAISIIFGGPIGLVGGMVFVFLAVYFGSGHYDNLSGGTLRQRLS